MLRLRRQVLWTFSIYLEAVAILPQLVMLQNSGNVDILTGHYVFFLGCVKGELWCCSLSSSRTQCIPRALPAELDLPLFP